VLEDATFEQDLIAATPFGRLAEPADVARVVAFLALSDSAYVTGQLIAVDGGKDRSDFLVDIWRNGAASDMPLFAPHRVLADRS